MSQITGEAKSVVSTSGALNSFIYLILRKKKQHFSYKLPKGIPKTTKNYVTRLA